MDYGLDVRQFRLYVVRPALERIDLWSHAAENLVLGTCLHESRLRWLDQIDKAGKPGPAYGPGQMEGPTHEDCWVNYLRYQQSLRRLVIKCAPYFSGDFPDPSDMRFHLLYACVMVRIKYRRVPAALPLAKDAIGLAQYWKQHYNTHLGKGTVAQALPHFEHAVGTDHESLAE